MKRRGIWVLLISSNFHLSGPSTLMDDFSWPFHQMRSSLFSIATVVSLFWTRGACHPRNRHRMPMDMMKDDVVNYDYNSNYSTTSSDTPTTTIYSVNTYIFSYLDPLEVTSKGTTIQCTSDSTPLCKYTPSLTQSVSFAGLPSMTECPTSTAIADPQFPIATYSSSGEVCTVSNVYSIFEKGNLYVACDDQASNCKDFGLNFPGQMVLAPWQALTKSRYIIPTPMTSHAFKSEFLYTAHFTKHPWPMITI